MEKGAHTVIEIPNDDSPAEDGAREEGNIVVTMTGGINGLLPTCRLRAEGVDTMAAKSLIFYGAAAGNDMGYRIHPHCDREVMIMACYSCRSIMLRLEASTNRFTFWIEPAVKAQDAQGLELRIVNYTGNKKYYRKGFFQVPANNPIMYYDIVLG